jgi:hypothetical protein
MASLAGPIGCRQRAAQLRKSEDFGAHYSDKQSAAIGARGTHHKSDSPNMRVPFFVKNATYALRGGFLIRPLLISLALGLMGMILSSLEESLPAVSAWVPQALFPSHADPQIAQIMLAAIAGSIMTVVSIVFAILLMTLTLASMQFSPRILVSFVRDKVTQRTLGVFLGTFLYCMAALPAARSL